MLRKTKSLLFFVFVLQIDLAKSRTDFHRKRAKVRLTEVENKRVEDECGVATADRSPVFKVACEGGEAACPAVGAEESPWSVRVGTACTATLLSQRHVLTAAHCMFHLGRGFKRLCRAGKRKRAWKRFGKEDEEIFVYLGAADYTCLHQKPVTKQCLNETDRYKIPVRRAIIHPWWCSKRKGKQSGDVVVLELARDAFDWDHSSINVFPACLPKPKDKVPDVLRLDGFGRHAFSVSRKKGEKKPPECSNPSDRKSCLKKEYKIQERGVLRRTWLRHNAAKDSAKRRTIAVTTRGFDSCKGDSGGGVLGAVFGQGGPVTRWTAFGVVSRGTSCLLVANKFRQDLQKRKYKTTLSDVRAYVPWICHVSGLCPRGTKPKDH